jgi:hypothetical protein
MSKRAAPPRVVPSPFHDDGAGHRTPGRCPLCSERLNHGTVIYWQMPTDPPGLRRCVHALCVQEYGLFKRAMRPLL